MDAKAEFNVGDIVRMKKPHPCGSSNWEITQFVKAVREVLPKEEK